MSRYGARQWAKWKAAGAISAPEVWTAATIHSIAEIKGRGFMGDVDVFPPLKVGDVVCQDEKAWHVVALERRPFRGVLLRRANDPSSRPMDGPCEIARKA